jgi:alpha-amylase
MKKVQLVMTIHCHQPVGNFDSVFDMAYERSYFPFIEVLERHPGVRLALHYSGPLLEWIQKNKPSFIDKLAKLVQDGQIELVGGGHYEPMLSVLPQTDAIGQTEMMKEYISNHFNSTPTGIWLTERVWEPDLPQILSQAGVKYTLVDDTHFFYAGLNPQRLFGYYITEKVGSTVAIFPIDRQMRYAIPFKPVDEILTELEKDASEKPRGIIYGDDGEKFGVWPGTYDWVYKEGWLEKFFSALENTDWIESIPPKTYLEQYPPSGRIYLPTASYEEMLTWAMPTEAITRLENLKNDLENCNLSQKASPFIRGGIWQNFMTKYPEANHLHKKMLLVSKKLNDAMEDEEEEWSEDHEEAKRALFAGQCNCPYWHGLFGGLYLPHLRDAVYRQLIRAENILDRILQGEDAWISYDQFDFDCDSEDEILVENALMNVYIDPDEGGSITEIDYRPANFNLTNTLTRRKESYHRKLEENGQPEDNHDNNQPSSIHDIAKSKEPGLADKVVIDKHTRRCFLDRFPSIGTSIEDLQRSTYIEEGDFLGGRYHVERIGIDEEGECDFEIQMTRAGHLTQNGVKRDLVLEKTINVPPDLSEIYVSYKLRNINQEPLDLLFCPELNLSLLAGDDGKRHYEFEGVVGQGPRMKTSGEIEDASWFSLVDHYQGFKARLELEPPAALLRHPVETVSQSEEGFELLYQGSAIIPKWEMTIPPQSQQQVGIKIIISPTEVDSVVPVETSSSEPPQTAPLDTVSSAAESNEPEFSKDSPDQTLEQESSEEESPEQSLEPKE